MRICLRRREFIAALGCAAAAWPLAARGQQRTAMIGVLSIDSPCLQNGSKKCQTKV